MRTDQAGYGTLLRPEELASPALPRPRGALSECLLDRLSGPVGSYHDWPGPDDDVLFGEDGALALYCLYELHYRGFREVDDRWEWEPSLLGLRARLEARLEERLHEEIAAAGAGAPGRPDTDPADIAAILTEIISAPGGRSLSRYLAEDGSLEQFREYAVHRSMLQLKEADPHTWAIPRLGGTPKAALVEIQADEYGDGVERDMHQTLFAVTMLALGLDASYGAYLNVVPGPTLATVTVPTYFGLHRRHRGALIGHLAVFEMTSVEPMGAYSAALRRLGLGPGARHFYEVHVVADAHHQSVAARSLAAGLVAQESALAADIAFGARATMAIEGHCSEGVLRAWDKGGSALLGTVPGTPAGAPTGPPARALAGTATPV